MNEQEINCKIDAKRILKQTSSSFELLDSLQLFNNWLKISNSMKIFNFKNVIWVLSGNLLKTNFELNSVSHSIVTQTSNKSK